MEDEALVAAFMEATGCGPEDAFDRLASCGGHLGKAVNSFFSIDAGPSGSRRYYSPPPSPQVSVSEWSSEDDAVRARPVPARRTRVSRWDSETRVVGRSHRRSPSRSAGSGSGSSTRVSRWDSEAWSGRHRQRRYRRRDRSRESDSGSGTPGGGREADGSHNRSRRRRFREDIFSDGGEDDEESNNSRRRRRRLNPTELTSDSESDQKVADHNTSRHPFREDVHVISSDDDDDDDNDMLVEMEEAARQPPPPRNRTFEELFEVAHELTYKGGFHAAKAHAARRARWLLASVQSFDLPLPSLHQNRDVWGNDLVARCVRDRFVLWQADAAADDLQGEEESEAKKVLGYYGIPHDMLPVVVVVDPVTGQAMDVLHGSAAYDLNDFMLRLGPYTDTKPTIPVVAKKSTSASAGVQSNTRPATTATTAPTSSERAAVAAVATAPACQTGQEQQAPTTAVTKQAVAVAPCTGQQPESVEKEKVCKVRVRLADGRVVTKEFGSQCAVAALFAYCRSMLGAGGAPETTPFRLRRIVGRATEEISDQNASFENMGLHLTTVSLHLA